MNSNLKLKLADSANRLSAFAGMSELPNPDRILRRTGKNLDAYRELKNDPHVWSCIQSRKSGLIALEYFVESRGASKAIVKEIEMILADIDVPAIERDILEAPLFGWQPLEIVWKNSGGSFFYPEAISARPHEWFFFDPDLKLMIRQSGIKGKEVPKEKALVASYEANSLNPYGEALLSKCYWPVTFKNGGLRLWVAFMEKYGMPLLLGKYNRGASEAEAVKLAEELAMMTRDAVIVAPGDIDIELKEAARGSSSSLYRDLIKHCNSEISKAILSQTLTTELDKGSYAASMTHYKIRREVIQSDARIVEKTFNDIIKLIVSINFSGSPAPAFKLVLNDADNDKRLDRDVKLISSGKLNFTNKYWIEHYGFKPEEIETNDDINLEMKK